MMRTALAAITVGLSLLVGVSRTNAASVTLYDASIGTLPQNQGSLAFGNVNRNPPYLSPVASETLGSGYTSLNSTGDNNIYAGYSNYNFSLSLSPSPSISPSTYVNPSFPTLDRNAGYTISFNVQILSQANDGPNGPNRAGFSVIVLSSDKQGIEIGFRKTDVFSQSGPNFTVGEINNSPNVSTLLGALSAYNLNISGNTYTLTSNGTNILSGNLRDYTAATGFAGDVYRTPNFLFFGDDTTSARADINLGSISINSNTAAVPYGFSPTWGLLILATWSAVTQLKKKKL